MSDQSMFARLEEKLARGGGGLIFVDLALLTFLMVFPNPLRLETWPTAFQYSLSEFSCFYIFLAAATLAHSWRTIVAVGTWATGLWATALILVTLFGTQMPDLSKRIARAVAGHERILDVIDPNDPGFPDRVQEPVIFLIVGASSRSMVGATPDWFFSRPTLRGTSRPARSTRWPNRTNHWVRSARKTWP